MASKKRHSLSTAQRHGAHLGSQFVDFSRSLCLLSVQRLKHCARGLELALKLRGLVLSGLDLLICTKTCQVGEESARVQG